MDRIPRSLPEEPSAAGGVTARRYMAGADAVLALAALGQSTRLEIFRLLMRHEPGGLNAGAIAAHIGCPQNTLSSHVSILARAGLVKGAREGRSINYRADVDGMRELLGFLVTDCCGGHPELCGFLDSSRREAGVNDTAGQCGCRTE